MKLFLQWNSLIKYVCFITLILGQNNLYADKIAVIGGGAAGLVSAWILEEAHEVVLYEAEKRLGGHAHSVEVVLPNEKVILEAGAEFFNERYYPHFLKLLRHFNLPLHSFTLTSIFYKTQGGDKLTLPPLHDCKVELDSFTPINTCRLVQLRKVINKGKKILTTKNYFISLDAYLNELCLSNSFKTDFLYPFLAAAWGVKISDVTQLSAYNTLKYLIEGYEAKHYQWYEVAGGMSRYINVVKEDLRFTNIKLNAHVEIRKSHQQYIIRDQDGYEEVFDHVVFATNANNIGNLLRNIPEERDTSRLLLSIKYYPTTIAIHGDSRYMPEDKRDWQVVNIRYDGKQSATTMYKSWKSQAPVFKSWITYDVRAQNDRLPALPNHLYGVFTFQHPFTDRHYFDVQNRIAKRSGRNHIWYAGMWTHDNDSHESAIVSAIKVGQVLAPGSRRLEMIK